MQQASSANIIGSSAMTGLASGAAFLQQQQQSAQANVLLGGANDMFGALGAYAQQQQQQQGTPSLPATMGAKTYGDEDKVFALVQELLNPVAREAVLLELSKRRETFDDLAPVLWHSFGAIYGGF
jgi:CCR4-NOT transcription complex subunit 9